MLMKRIRVISAVLCVILIVGMLGGCSKQQKVSDSNTTVNSKSENVKDDSNDKNEELVEEPTEISMLVLTVADFDPETFPSVKVIEEKLNIKLNYEFAPSSSYTEKLQISLVSNDYPDLIMFDSASSTIFLDAVDSEIIVPVTEWVKESDNLLKYTNADAWEAMKVLNNEEIYAIPRSTMMRSDGFVIRKDWCDNLGIALPEDGIVTADELYDIMSKFTFNDPDQNGVNDTYGFTMATDSNGNLDPRFTEAFGLIGWQEVTGEEHPYMNGMYAKNNTVYRNALEFNAKLWKDGILSPETPLNKTSSDAIDGFRQNKVGIIQEFAANAVGYLQKLQELVPTAEMSYLFLEDSTGNVQGDAFGSGYWWLNAITTSAAGKEAKIVEFLDYLLSDEGWEICTYGPEGITWDKDADGNRIINQEEFAKISPAKNHFTQVRRNNDPDFFFNVNLTAEEKELPMSWVMKSIDIAKVSLDQGYVPQVATSSAYIDYQNILDSTITKVILGNSTIEDYNKALNDWYNNGGAEYVAEMNEYIASKQQ